MLTQGLCKTIPLSVRLENSPTARHYIVLNLYSPAEQFADTFSNGTKGIFHISFRLNIPASGQLNIHQSLNQTRLAQHNCAISNSNGRGMSVLSLKVHFTLMTDAVINSSTGCVYPFPVLLAFFLTIQKQLYTFNSLQTYYFHLHVNISLSRAVYDRGEKQINILVSPVLYYGKPAKSRTCTVQNRHFVD